MKIFSKQWWIWALMTHDHKNTSVLSQAIKNRIDTHHKVISKFIDGDSISMLAGGDWCVVDGDRCDFNCQRKFQVDETFIMVNGFKVPKPLANSRPYEFNRQVDYFIPCLHTTRLSTIISTYCHEYKFKRGIVHATRENAAMHAKAMMGFDPNLPLPE